MDVNLACICGHRDSDDVRGLLFLALQRWVSCHDHRQASSGIVRPSIDFNSFRLFIAGNGVAFDNDCRSFRPVCQVEEGLKTEIVSALRRAS